MEPVGEKQDLRVDTSRNADQPNLTPPVTPTTVRDKTTKRNSRYLNLKRLPTLQEVLDRRTRTPLDLFCFYIFLQRENSEDVLDFWLDVQQHENLCKAYFKVRDTTQLTEDDVGLTEQDLRRSGRPVAEDWPEFAQYARSNGSYITPYLNLNEAAGETRDGVSAGMEGWGQEQPTNHSQDELAPLPAAHHRQAGDESPIHSPVAQSPLLAEESLHGSHSSLPGVRGRTSRASLRGWAQRSKATRAPTVFTRDRAIEKQALVDSAERIYLRYLLPGAEREIYLPPALRMTNFPVSENGHVSPQIPDLFHAQKLFIFRALEQDAFPRFLRAKAFGNLTPVSSLLHLILGLIVLWGSFVLAFTFIFLDWQPKSHRLYMIIPFFFAFNLLLAAYYSLSPILAFLFQSETTPFHLITIRESYVRKLLFLRALWVEALAIFLTAVFTIIFTLVPGKRL